MSATIVVGHASRREWAGVIALSLGAFALVASEFMPVSLLTPIASDLHVTEGQAGQAIAVSGAFALVTSLVVAPLAGRLDRKFLLLAFMLAMVLSGSLAAFAPDFTTFMLGRALIGVAIGGFWSLSAATAMRLVPEHQVPRALAIVNGGNALATVIAAPLGSFIGGMVGWRGAFFALVPVALLALAWKAAVLPSMKTSDRPATWNVFALLRPPVVAWGMAASAMFFMGQFTLFTYLRPYLEVVSHVGPNTLSALLLLLGGCGVLGTVVIERFLGRWLYHVLGVLPVLMAAIGLILAWAGPSLPLTTCLMALWGLFATSAPVAWWTWLAKTLPQDSEAAGGLMVAIVQLSIALGATVGGLLYDHCGYHATFSVAAVLLVISTLAAARAGATARPIPAHDPVRRPSH